MNRELSGDHSVSSPIATGAGGPFFEQHVDALFLALLLVRGIPPILKDCQVREVHFQTEHLGWSTDDLLIIGTKGAGCKRQLAAQVKRQFTISSKNEDSKKAFVDFWNDFRNHDIFDPETDRLALITLRGTDTLLSTFNNLLDCARASFDGVDFANRLTLDGFLSKKARGHAEKIKSIIEENDGQAPSDDEFCRFLRALHVVSFDLNTPTAQNEAWIKTLLAQTSHDSDPVAGAEATWRELLEMVSTGMPLAASYKHGDLPESLRNRHEALASLDSRDLQALAAHSETTLKGIHTTIAHSVRIRRDALVAKTLEHLDETQVVMVTGPAGSGKSALAKSVVELLRRDLFCLVFRAEEFAASHIDRTLQQAQTSLNVKRLLALWSAQGRKVILVESVERLLEASVRDAFSDLLRLVQQDRSIHLLLTCRDYSVDTVRMSLLEQAALEYHILEVPQLTDDELAQVEQEIPALSRAFEDSNLKELLRSPYFLDKAARIDWSDEGPLPNNERAFRTRCWSEVVRSDVDAGGGMPRRRERVFLDLALRRARQLRLYVPSDDLDAEALEALRKDDLVTVSKENSALAAPAHDVLEDWAIIHWLGAEYTLHERDALAFANDIGGYPAIRRGYRKWLSEMLECEAKQADSFVLSSFKDEKLPSYFRDDTIICTLLSSSAQDFLARNRGSLLAHDSRLLVRVVHLLRVACKTTLHWLPGSLRLSSQLLVPTGEAWAPVLKIVSDELDNLLPKQLGVLLGLVEDWSRWVSYWQPEPPGFSEVGKITFRLLEHLGGYGSKDLRKRVLDIIAKTPRANTAAFEELVLRGCTLDRSDLAATELAEILLNGISGGFACRDFPEQMVQLTMRRCCLSNEDLQDRWEYDGISIEPFFGIREHTNHDFFPASAIRGPFFSLLQSHPRIGVKFITDLVNHACSWYGEQRWPPYDQLEPAWQLTLDLPGEEPITQWANGRLYGLFRGATVGPYVLQTALMALEHWLLEVCKLPEIDIEPWLSKLLKDSNNIAVTAIVASVCSAHPEKGVRAALALLTSMDLIDMDRSRMAYDQTHPSMSDLVPSFNVANEIYDNERKKADSLPHRRSDLESLAVKLQFSELREEVWQIIDQHRDTLPPIEKQSEEHRLRRLALHRMDIRGFGPTGEVPTSEVEKVIPDSDTSGQRYVYIGPNQIEPDLQEIVDQNAQRFSQHNADLSLLNWGHSAWNRTADGSDLSSWEDMLARAKERDRDLQEMDSEQGQYEFTDFTSGGPGFIAAVCVRDHWEDMSLDDQRWCVEKLINEVERDSDSDDNLVRHSRGGLFPNRHAAYVLPRVLSETTTEESDPRIIAAIATALTHSVTEVIAYAADGVGFYLQASWQNFASRCAGALARQARLIEEVHATEKSKPFQHQLRGPELIRSIVPTVRRSIISGDIDEELELNQLNTREWPGRQAARSILSILGYWRDSTLAVQSYARVNRALIEDWDEKKRDRYVSGRRDYYFESWFAERVAGFALNLQVSDALAVYEPLLEAVGDHPHDVDKFVRHLILEEDRSEGETPFWDVWQTFAERFCDAPWIKNLDSRHPTGEGLLRDLFLGIEWKEGVRHWRRLEGQGGRIDALVRRLPAAAVVLEAYCRFLYQIGDHSIPNGFVVIEERLKAGNPREALAKSNTVFYLESLLQRYVYGEPLRLKSKPQVRAGVLWILDQLVEAGSSAAYRMRDDFVTPATQ